MDAFQPDARATNLASAVRFIYQQNLTAGQSTAGDMLRVFMPRPAYSLRRSQPEVGQVEQETKPANRIVFSTGLFTRPSAPNDQEEEQ